MMMMNEILLLRCVIKINEFGQTMFWISLLKSINRITDKTVILVCSFILIVIAYNDEMP